MIQLHQGMGSVGHQLDQAAALQACHRVRIADGAQDFPLQQLGGGQYFHHLALPGTQRLQPELQGIVQFPIAAQRTPQLPTLFGMNQGAAFHARRQKTTQ